MDIIFKSIYDIITETRNFRCLNSINLIIIIIFFKKGKKIISHSYKNLENYLKF
jgi:hypothetical protein